MKRWAPLVLRICVFLLLGAIVNIAVAWGCMVHYIREKPYRVGGTECGWMSDGIRCHMWRRDFVGITTVKIKHSNEIPCAHDEDPLVATPSWAMAFLAPDERVFDLSPMHKRTFQDESFLILGSGLPCLSLWCVGEHVVDLGSSSQLLSSRGALWMWPGARQIPQPFIPIWPGFAINTLFYAGILWLLFAAPFALRRRRRLKRGLCPACAYPVGASDACTECGQALSR